MDSTGTPRRSRFGPYRIIHAMLTAVAWVAPDAKPRLQRRIIRAWYSFMSAIHPRKETIFQNFGWAPLNDVSETLPLEKVDRDDSYAIQLYHRVVIPRELDGLHVLEVGCGRGGGASFMARYL